MDPQDKDVEQNDDDSIDPVTVPANEDTDTDTDDSPEPQQQQRPGQVVIPPKTKDGQQPQRRQPGQGSPNRPSKFVARRDLDAATAQITQLSRQLAEIQGELRGRAAAGGQPSGGGEKTPEEKQIASINAQMNSIIKQSASANLSDEERQALGAQFNDLAAQREELNWNIREAALIAKIRGQVQQDMPDQKQNVYAGIVAKEFPQIIGNKPAARAAQVYLDDLVEKNGGVEHLGLYRQACAWAVRAFGLGNSQPTRGERGRTVGVPGSGGPRGNPGEVTFDPEDIRITDGAPVSLEDIAEQIREEAAEANGRSRRRI
jgi:hypothetical protein